MVQKKKCHLVWVSLTVGVGLIAWFIYAQVAPANRLEAALEHRDASGPVIQSIRLGRYSSGTGSVPNLRDLTERLNAALSEKSRTPHIDAAEVWPELT